MRDGESETAQAALFGCCRCGGYTRLPPRGPLKCPRPRCGGRLVRAQDAAVGDWGHAPRDARKRRRRRKNDAAQRPLW